MPEEGQQNNEPSGGDPGNEPASQGATGGKTFSQEDVSKLVGDTRQKATETATKKLLEQLGVTDLDAAKRILEEKRAAEEAAKTEAQRLAEERDRAKAEAVDARRQANQLVAVSELKGALRDAGINPERIASAMRLVDFEALKVEGTGVEGLGEAVEKIKTDSPEWFGKRVVAAPDATGTGTNSVTTDYSKVPLNELDDHLRTKYGLRIRS